MVVDQESVSNAGGAIQAACISPHTSSIDETVYRLGFCMRSNFCSSLRVCIEAGCVYLCVMSSHILFVDVLRMCAHAHHPRWDVAAFSAMSGTASLRVAAGENDDDEIKILCLAEGAAAISLAAVSIDLFQHLTFNHDKTVGKLIVLQDIRHQSPLILSGAPRCMNTNRLSRQPSHLLLSSHFLHSHFPSLCLLFFPDSSFPLLFLCFPPSPCLFVSLFEFLSSKNLKTKLWGFFVVFLFVCCI